MKGIGSDVIALAAVLGSAAVAGVVTLALAASDSGKVAYECMATGVESGSHVVVALNSGHTAVVVAPEVQASSAEVCAEVLVERIEGDERHLARVRSELDRAQEGLERSRHRLREDLERIERVKRVEHVERVERVERVLRVRDRHDQVEHEDEVEHEIEKTRVMVDGVTIELEGLEELLDLELEGLGEALALEFGGRAHVDEEMERLDVEIREIDEDIKEELKRIIDELRRKRRGGGR